MTNGQIRDLCIALLHSEAEEEVIALLSKAGFWDKPALWRNYGDVENNWGQGGNQQSLAEAALVEKIVNAVDARLINECLERNIDPRGAEAPKNIREAVARFFEGGTGKKLSTGGTIDDWHEDRIREVAQGITVTSTGQRPVLNLTVSDCGEGQTPGKLPTTIMSLSKPNKMYIPFVQGQFNQGGTGALRFCGNHNLQLVISRRNPKLLGPDPDADDSKWGFTVVRRERPQGGRRNSIYTYLAPVGVGSEYADRNGRVLAFVAETLDFYPDKEKPYGRAARYGTSIKLFDYKYLGERSNILRGQSILSRLDLLLPEIALPIRVYEFRSSGGKYLPQGSRETTLSGLRRRLNNTPNVEAGFPIALPFAPAGEQLLAVVYAFKPAGTSRSADDEEETASRKKLGGLKRYRKREGVLFVRNGQTQGTLPKDFFRREEVKLKPLADDLLVFIECDRMSDDVREDLFMPSRDRLTENEFKVELIDGLEQTLRNDDTLRQLRNRRQQDQTSEKMKDDKPLADVLQQLIRRSPNLTALLHLGQRITAPFNTQPAGRGDEKPFKGEVYPTFFKWRNVPYGQVQKRDCPINYRMRLTFETDARDDYFSRRIEGGQFSLCYVDEAGNQQKVSFVGPTLRRGSASVMVTLPEGAEVNSTLRFVATTRDTRTEFENKLDVVVRPWSEHREGGRKNADQRAPSKANGKDRERPQQLDMPKIEPIYRDHWGAHKFDEHTAMTVGCYYDEANEERNVFRINMDNVSLLNEIKLRKLDDASARNQFMYGNILVGLSMLHQHNAEKKSAGASPQGKAEDQPAPPPVEDRIERTCRGLAPFMLALTSLSLEDLSERDDGLDGLEAATG
ncbi:hypothetical protein [Enhydrobacter sp.]|jgi:hypothetical protein|uniref:hypothetical protein n=1 Tax=Enhydrobacter sp. TaxID=1894999 RepID=UPI00262B1263|nr:hypothetical protein [Enhydrobacter sp.]WIM10145.1 MAG: hypothetical protein OJF58_001099 [Enhydrobacter sp.]